MKLPKISFGSLPRFKPVTIGNPTANQVEIFGVENSAITSGFTSDEKTLAIFRRAHNRGVDKVKPSMINPLNADFVKPHLPKPGQMAFILMNGNCQGIDLIMAMIKAMDAPPSQMILSSLSANAETFERLDRIKCTKEILISSYFLATDKANLLPRLWRAGKLKGYRIGLWRNHTKHVLIRSGENFYFGMGSANFRSSGTIESMVVVNDRRIYEFNRKWMQHLIRREPIEKYLETGTTNTNGFFTFLDDDNVDLTHE